MYLTKKLWFFFSAVFAVQSALISLPQFRQQEIHPDAHRNLSVLIFTFPPRNKKYEPDLFYRLHKIGFSQNILKHFLFCSQTIWFDSWSSKINVPGGQVRDVTMAPMFSLNHVTTLFWGQSRQRHRIMNISEELTVEGFSSGLLIFKESLDSMFILLMGSIICFLQVTKYPRMNIQGGN